MAYTFDSIFAADPSNPANVASNAAITIFDPNDPGKAPITITDATDSPLANPITVNKNGFGPAFKHATLDRVGWAGAGFEGFFTSYEGMKNEAVAARAAAESAEADTAVAISAVVTTAKVDGSGHLVLTRADESTVDAGIVVGPKGDKGDQGVPGVNAVANDSATAGYINDANSETSAALSAKVVPQTRVGSLNKRMNLDQGSKFDSTFAFSGISANEDGWLVGKNAIIEGGFGGQTGQGGLISYFKWIGHRLTFRGVGNYDHYWASVKHEGEREAGLFIGDIHGDRGGNSYGAHFRARSSNTAPQFLVGASFEIVPDVARGATSTAALAAEIPANTETTSITLSAPVQLTAGTNLSFTAGDATKVVAYVAANMGAASATVTVKPFTTASAIASGSTVTIGVASSYFGAHVQNAGSHAASAAFHIDAPLFTGNRATVAPYLFGINIDSSAAHSSATALMIGGAWGSGINMNANSIVQVGSVTGTGSSPNRDVRVADNLVIDNARHIKFKDAAGASKKVVSVTGSDNFRFIAPGASKQFEFYDSTEATLLGRITGSGRADFATGGVTTKYTSGATQPGYLTNGQVEVWHDTGSGTSYLVVSVNGVSKKVALA